MNTEVSEGSVAERLGHMLAPLFVLAALIVMVVSIVIEELQMLPTRRALKKRERLP